MPVTKIFRLGLLLFKHSGTSAKNWTPQCCRKSWRIRSWWGSRITLTPQPLSKDPANLQWKLFYMQSHIRELISKTKKSETSLCKRSLTHSNAPTQTLGRTPCKVWSRSDVKNMSIWSIIYRKYRKSLGWQLQKMNKRSVARVSSFGPLLLKWRQRGLKRELKLSTS